MVLEEAEVHIANAKIVYVPAMIDVETRGYCSIPISLFVGIA